MLSPQIFLASYILLSLSLLVAIFISALKESVSSTLKPAIFFFSAFAALIGVRSIEVGVDTASFYSWTPDRIILFTKEPLYWGLATIGKMLLGFTGSMLAVSTVAFYAYYQATKRVVLYSPDHTKPGANGSQGALLILLLAISSSDFLILNINQVRQGLAGALLCLAAINFFYKEKQFAIYMLLAPLAHTSALFFIPLIFIAKRFNSPAIPLCLLFISVIFWQTNAINSIIPYIPSEYIQGKLSVAIYQTALTSQTTLIIKTFLSASFILSLLFFIPSSKHNKQLFLYLYTIFSLTICASIFLLEFGEGANRVQRYACFFLPILICLAIEKLRPKKLAFGTAGCISFIYLILMILYPSTLGTIGVR